MFGVFKRTFIDDITGCRHYAHPRRPSQGTPARQSMTTPLTVSRALSASGLVPFEAKLLLAHVPPDRESRVLDLGTGSGAVALAIAAGRRKAQIIATDVSRPALALAARNAARLGIGNVTFVESDWFEALPDERFDLVAGNPPYVAAGDSHLTKGDLRHEPQQA